MGTLDREIEGTTSATKNDTDQSASRKSEKGWLRRWFKWKILVSVLSGVGLTMLGAWINKKIDQYSEGPSEYSIYIVGGYEEAADSFVDEFYTAFREAFRQLPRVEIAGKGIAIRRRADRWEPEQAFEVAGDIADSPDTLMVVGHFSSSTTREALKRYSAADPPVPVILTTETNPNLLPQARTSEPINVPVLRLWPTDDQQAIDIVKYAQLVGDSFWVVEDLRLNRVYSEYLSKTIIDELQKGGSNVVLWTDSAYLPPTGTLLGLGIDAVLFPGTDTSALIFANQIRRIWSGHEGGRDAPKIFITDGAMGENLYNRESDLEGVYMTHPGLEPCKALHNQKPHIELARNAARLVHKIIEEGRTRLKPRWWRDVLEVKSVVDAREAINAAIREDMMGQSVRLQGNIVYHFNNKGNREGARFKLWQFNNGLLEEVVNDNNTLVSKECVL